MGSAFTIPARFTSGTVYVQMEVTGWSGDASVFEDRLLLDGFGAQELFFLDPTETDPTANRWYNFTSELGSIYSHEFDWGFDVSAFPIQLADYDGSEGFTLVTDESVTDLPNELMPSLDWTGGNSVESDFHWRIPLFGIGTVDVAVYVYSTAVATPLRGFRYTYRWPELLAQVAR